MFRDIVKAKNTSDMVSETLLFVLSILITTFVLRFLWNKSLVKHISVLKPINTMLDAFILSLSLSIIKSCGC